MKRIRWRLRPLLVLAAVATSAVALFSAYTVIRTLLSDRLRSLLQPSQVETLLNQFASAFAVFSILAILASAVLALVLGSAAAGMLVQLRAHAISRARRKDRPMHEPPILELRALAHAIDRLADESEGREIKLIEERDELGLLVGSASEGILLVSAEGRIIQVNPAARAMLRLPQNSRGQPLRSVIRNAQLRAVPESLHEGTPPTTTEITIDDRRLLFTARPLLRPDPLGSPDAVKPSIIITLVDLTELRRLEGVRRDFVANVSHELKTPLTSIRGYVETLMTDELDPSLQRQFLDVIHKNAERLHSIVDDLLDLSRLESGGWRPNLEEVNATQITQEVWEICADRARERGIEFTGPTRDVRVRADRSALRQILSNLFDNALRYTPQGGSIGVSFQTDPAPPSEMNRSAPDAGAAAARSLVAIEVRDTGSGIPGDSLPRIFERFYRVDPARSRAEGGTGLGLSIVKHLTESMGGEVTATSEVGKGTTIRVRIPAA